MTDPNSDLERRALSRLDGVMSAFEEHSRLLILAGVGFLGLSLAGITNPGLPDWWPLVPIMAIAAGLAGYFGAAKVYQLIPDREGILLVAFTTTDGKGGELWEIYEDTWEEMNVEGTLHQWTESPRRIYECRSYDPETNTAVANWRETKPASELAAERTVDDAFGAIRELRKDLEPSVAEARELRRRIRGIIRQLDEERVKARAKQLDEATLDKGLDSTTISDAIDDNLPDHLHPDAGGGDEESKKNGDTPHPEAERVDIELDDIEPLDIEEEAGT